MIATRHTTNYYSNTNSNNSSSSNISYRRLTLDEKNNWTTDESGDESYSINKDRFIELAQAALGEAALEEQKGVFREFIEAMIDLTGASQFTKVISEQFQSQDVIELLAEDHFNSQQEKRRYSNSSNSNNINCSSSSSSSSISSSSNNDSSSGSNDNISSSGLLDMNDDDCILKEPQEEQNMEQMLLANCNSNSIDMTNLVSEYIWRLFRLLILASLVGLVYHYFMCADPNQPNSQSNKHM